MKKLLLITLFALSLKAESPEPKLVEETTMYRIYCIKETLWIKWNGGNTQPVQMFRMGSQSVPMRCE